MSAQTPPTSNRDTTFRKLGHSYHLHIAQSADLESLIDLDQAHWVATSAPMDAIRCDPTFLSLIDADNDGRIRASELKAAIRWTLDQLGDTNGVTNRSRVLRLSAVNTDAPDGKRIHSSAKRMLASLNQQDGTEIDLEQIRKIKSSIESMPVSEAGVVLAETGTDSDVCQFIRDIMTVVGGAPHPSGTMGVGTSQLSQFRQQINAYMNWYERGDVQTDTSRAELYPLGNETCQAYAQFAELSERIDQFFNQCQTLGFYRHWGDHQAPHVSSLTAENLKDAGAIEQFLKEAPLAPPLPECKLGFDNSVNPRDRDQLVLLRDQVLVPLLGESVAHLTVGQWQTVKQRFAAYDRWIKAKPSDAVASLGLEKMQTYRDAEHFDKVRALISQGGETVIQLNSVRLVEKLVLFQTHLIDLANNFVSFPWLYDPEARAMFERGSLVMDGRRFNLAIQVNNRAEHAQIAQSSNMFVLYVRIERLDVPKPVEMALPVTSGGKGNLMVGKRGIFLDIDDREWDARVIQIIENPISFREALVAPVKRIGKVVSGKIEQITGVAEKQLDTATQQTVNQVQTTVSSSGQTSPPAASHPPPSNRGMLAGGVLAGGGLAIAALGSAAAFITKTFANLEPLTIVASITGALMAVLLPTVILASIKLRRRDLSAILEGSGWAINAQMRLKRALCRVFTQRPNYPHDAKGIHTWRWWMTILVLCALLAGASVGGYQVWRTSRAPNATPKAASPAPPDPAPDVTPK